MNRSMADLEAQKNFESQMELLSIVADDRELPEFCWPSTRGDVCNALQAMVAGVPCDRTFPTLDALIEQHDSPIVFMRSLAVKVRSRAPVPVRACLFAQGTKGRLLSCGADAGEVCRITARSAVHDLAPGGAHVFCLQTGGQNQYFAIVIALHLTHVEDPEEHDDA